MNTSAIETHNRFGCAERCGLSSAAQSPAINPSIPRTKTIRAV